MICNQRVYITSDCNFGILILYTKFDVRNLIGVYFSDSWHAAMNDFDCFAAHSGGRMGRAGRMIDVC